MVVGPLQHLKVVELAGIGPAPLAARWLADMGAQVLRVNRPGAPPAGPDGLGTGRPALVADLKDPADLRRVRSALDAADALIEGFRPGTTERLGLGPADCLATNPRLIYVRMTGWGQHGPRAGAAGHDINYLSATGALHAIGPAGGAPVPPLNLLADFGGGSMFAIAGLLAALFERTTSGRGQVVDAAMVDGVSYLLTMIWGMLGAGTWRDERGVNTLDGGAPFYTTYRCADGGYLAVGALEPQFYAALVAGLELADLPAREQPANWPALRERFAAAFATRTRAEWLTVFDGTDACVTAVASFAEARADAHLAARGVLPEVAGQVRPAPAPRFSSYQLSTRRETGLEGFELLASWGVSW